MMMLVCASWGSGRPICMDMSGMLALAKDVPVDIRQRNTEIYRHIQKHRANQQAIYQQARL